MSFIHQPTINKILRTIVKPFAKIIPDRFHFAINGKVEINLTEGKVLIFSGNPTSHLLNLLFWKGIKGFEYDAYNVFVHLAKKSNFFMDIGANIGYYSILAKLFNPRIRVIGFEPLPAAYKYFIKNRELNNITDIKLEQMALSDKKGVSTFYSPQNKKMKDYSDQLVGDSSLAPYPTETAIINTIQVQTEMLDNYIENELNAEEFIDLIKMDTEATEDLVLKGAQKVLSTHRPVIMCEILKNGIGENVQKILLTHNYTFYKLQAGGLLKVTSLISEKDKDDFFMVPPEKIERIKEFII